MMSTIEKWGNSSGIRLPELILKNLDMKDNDSVDVLTENDTIVIKKSVAHRQHKTIKQRVEDFYGKDFETALKENPYEYKEMTWGKPVGDEIW